MSNSKSLPRHSRWVTQDQIERARQVNILDYILANEPDSVRRVGSGYRLKEHPSFAISNDGWYQHSKQSGGVTALDYLTNVRGYNLIDAVCTLINEDPKERPSTLELSKKATAHSPKANASTQLNSNNIESVLEENLIPQSLILPFRNGDNKRVIAYLRSRGIDRDLIMACIERGALFESRYYHNAVFIGRDEQNKPRFAAIRSTTSKFLQDANGSNKRYGFKLPPTNPGTHEIAVFESPIDALSHQTLCKQGHIPPFKGWRLSLGGTGTLALNHFLKTHPHITHCLIGTDNDEAGNIAAVNIVAIKGITYIRSSPPKGKDWNETLQCISRATQAHNSLHQNRALNL